MYYIAPQSALYLPPPSRPTQSHPSILPLITPWWYVHPSKTVLFDWVGFESNYDVILFTAISFVVSFTRPLLAWMPRDVHPVHSRALLCAPRLSPLGLHEPFHEPFATWGKMKIGKMCTLFPKTSFSEVWSIGENWLAVIVIGWLALPHLTSTT